MEFIVGTHHVSTGHFGLVIDTQAYEMEILPLHIPHSLGIWLFLGRKNMLGSKNAKGIEKQNPSKLIP